MYKIINLIKSVVPPSDIENVVPKLSDDVINQIKEFNYRLTQEQIDELIPNKDLKERYIKHGLCVECGQPKTGDHWCQSCNSKQFQQDFNKWSSGNKEIDEFIQNFQLNANCKEEVLEWIPYEKFKDIKFLAKGGFGTVYRAKWIDGYIRYWNNDQNKWKRNYYVDIVLKVLNNSQNLTVDYLQKICILPFIIDIIF
jgi:hypothetical protein